MKNWSSHFNEYFKSIREEQNLREVAEWLYIFPAIPGEVEKFLQSNSSDNCIHHDNGEILNLFDQEWQMINTNTVIKNKLEELLNGSKEFKVQKC